MQRPKMSEILQHLTVNEIRRLSAWKARYTLEACGFTRAEAGRLMFHTTRAAIAEDARQQA